MAVLVADSAVEGGRRALELMDRWKSCYELPVHTSTFTPLSELQPQAAAAAAVRLCATGSCPDSIQNYTAPTHQHPTSSDPFGHGAALLAFFEHDARPWRKAIELLYKLDRDCFGLGPGWSADQCATTPPPRPLKSPHTDK